MGIFTRQAPEPRKGMPSPRLGEQEFKQRFLDQFVDPAFAQLQGELAKLATAAWEAYVEFTEIAAHPEGRARIRRSRIRPRRGLDSGSSGDQGGGAKVKRRQRCPVARAPYQLPRPVRSIHAPVRCRSPGGSFKSHARCWTQRTVSKSTSSTSPALPPSTGRNIHPCKACFSTAPALCHWPCSCYPNYSLGQTHDWMNDIYPMWVAAHGIMIVTPVNWYQTSSPLKLMMDRMVCADGGNPDPTRRRQGCEEGEGDRVARLGLSSAPGRKTILGRGARRRGGRGECAPLDLGLALLHAPLPGRPARRARPLHWLLEAILRQATTSSIRTRHCKRRFATPRERFCRRSLQSAPACWLRRGRDCSSRGKSRSVRSSTRAGSPALSVIDTGTVRTTCLLAPTANEEQAHSRCRIEVPAGRHEGNAAARAHRKIRPRVDLHACAVRRRSQAPAAASSHDGGPK